MATVLTQRSLIDVNEANKISRAYCDNFGVELIRRSGSRRSDSISEVRNRRILPVAGRRTEGPLTEPTADVWACRWELVKLPQNDAPTA